MKIVAHKNDFTGDIDMPVILIAEGNYQTAEEIAAGIDISLEPMVLDNSELPSDRYIKSWYIANGQININMETAKDHVRGFLRMWRTKFLSELDIAFQRAMETGADTTEIVAQKQYYRDVTSDPRIDAAQTTDELDSLLDLYIKENT